MRITAPSIERNRKVRGLRLRSGLLKLSHKRLIALSIALACAVTTHAQAPYPSTAMPQAAWGGYEMPDAVPYQPTLDPSCQSPGPSEAWQIYPAAPLPDTPIVTVPQPGEVQFPQPLATPAGLKPWFPPGGRNGVFQKVKFTGAYLPRFSDDSLGMSDLQLDVVFGLPFFTVETPILITPFYGIHFTDGPDTPDVPPRLHDAAVMFQHVRPLSDHWLAMLDLTLGEYADDESFNSSEAFRITGGGAGVYRPNDLWKWVLGATYVNRANTQILPVAGFIYTPNDDVEYRAVFPAPRFAWRLPWSDVPGTDERWFYIGGEFGGGAWAVQRTDGTNDRLDITDWRIFLGLERRIIGGLSRRIEVGYVFSRTLEYESDGKEVDLPETMMLRAGLTY